MPTKIARISGPTPPANEVVNFSNVTKHFQSEIKEAQRVAAQKRAAIPRGEMIQFSKLTEGEAKAQILLRQMQILAATNPEKQIQYKEAMGMIKTALHGGGRGFVQTYQPTGVIKNELQAIAGVLKYASQNQIHPALNFSRQQKRAMGPVSAIGAPASEPLFFPFDLSSPPPNYLTYYLGRGSVDYERKLNEPIQPNGVEFGQLYTDILNAMAGEQAMDAQGNPATVTIPFTNSVMPVPKLQVWNGQNNTALNAPYSKQNLYNLANDASINFYDNEYKEDFLARVKSASGIFDQYLNTVFAENGAIGNGFIYAYAPDATNSMGQPININDYPQAVAAKYGVHLTWIDRCSYFSGLSLGNLKMMGSNTIAANNGGQLPTQMLGDLMQGYNPAIGIEPATIAIIIGAVVSLLSTAMQVMGKAKNQGDQIDTQGMPTDWIPIGPPLQFAGDDWTTAPPTTNGGGGNGGAKKTNFLPYALAAGGAALLLMGGGNGKNQ